MARKKICATVMKAGEQVLKEWLVLQVWSCTSFQKRITVKRMPTQIKKLQFCLLDNKIHQKSQICTLKAEVGPVRKHPEWQHDCSWSCILGLSSVFCSQWGAWALIFIRRLMSQMRKESAMWHGKSRGQEPCHAKPWSHGEDGKLHNHCSSADVTSRDTTTLFIGFSHVTFPTHPSYSWPSAWQYL